MAFPSVHICINKQLADSIKHFPRHTAYNMLLARNCIVSIHHHILLGKLLKETNICSLETMQKAIEKVVPPKKAALIPNNFKAIDLGMKA